MFHARHLFALTITTTFVALSHILLVDLLVPSKSVYIISYSSAPSE